VPSPICSNFSKQSTLRDPQDGYSSTFSCPGPATDISLSHSLCFCFSFCWGKTTSGFDSAFFYIFSPHFNGLFIGLRFPHGTTISTEPKCNIYMFLTIIFLIAYLSHMYFNYINKNMCFLYTF